MFARMEIKVEEKLTHIFEFERSRSDLLLRAAGVITKNHAHNEADEIIIRITKEKTDFKGRELK